MPPESAASMRAPAAGDNNRVARHAAPTEPVATVAPQSIAARLTRLVPAWLIAIWSALIGATPWLGDDVANRQVRDHLLSFELLPGAIADETATWMRLQGRFFPGSLTWTRVLLWFVNDRVPYKIVLVALFTFALLAVALLAEHIARTPGTASLTVVTFGAFFQLRLLADPVVAYSGLIPLTAGLSAAAVLLVVRTSRWWWAVAAGLAYGAALVTYETVILFAPLMAGLILHARRRWPWTLAVVAPALAQATIVLWLRAHIDAASTVSAYTVGLEPKAVLVTFLRQMASALPLAQWIWRAPGMPPLDTSDVVLALVLVGIPVLLFTYRHLRGHHPTAWTNIALLAGSGLWFSVSSSVLVAVTVRWQQELDPGEGYVSVGYAQFGLALLAAAGVLAIEQVLDRAGSRSRHALAATAATGMALVASLTFAGDLLVARLFDTLG